LYLLLAGPWLLREPIRRRDLVLILIVASGMALFFAGSETVVVTAPDPARGNVIAALSGITWALTIAGLRWLARESHGEAASMAPVVTGNLIAILVCLPMALPVTQATPMDWLTLAYLGVFQIGLAYLCLTSAMRHVPAFEASTLLLAEPALNPFWSWLMHGERPSLAAITGGALILSASLINTWWHSRAR
jgi:drug/metabolite transporter (DMT)-like permease